MKTEERSCLQSPPEGRYSKSHTRRCHSLNWLWPVLRRGALIVTFAVTLRPRRVFRGALFLLAVAVLVALGLRFPGKTRKDARSSRDVRQGDSARWVESIQKD